MKKTSEKMKTSKRASIKKSPKTATALVNADKASEANVEIKKDAKEPAARKFSVLLLCFGDYPQYSLRALDSLFKNKSLNGPEGRIFDLHVASNNVGPTIRTKIREMVDAGQIDTVIEVTQNINKCPMKRLLYDRCQTEVAMWMDDDSHVLPDWDKKIVEFIEKEKPFDVAGDIRWFSRPEDYGLFVKRRPWFVSEEKCEAQIRFALGGLYLVNLPFARKHNFPDKGMIKKHDDVMLGDLVRQQDGVLKAFSQELLDVLKIDDGERRGTGEDVTAYTRLDPVTGVASTEPTLMAGMSEHEILQLCNQFRNEKKFKDAMEAAKFGERAYNQNAWFDLNIAFVHNDLEEMDEAVEAARRAVNKSANFVEGLFWLGVFLTKRRDVEDAIKIYERCVEAAPDFSGAWTNLGNLYSELGRKQEAVDAYSRCLELEPRLSRSAFICADNLAALGRDEEAIVHYRLALDAEPEFTPAAYNRAKARLRMGEYDQGFAEYSLVRQLNSTIKVDRRKFSNLDLKGKKIALLQDQVIPESVLFIRAAKMLAQAQAAVTAIGDFSFRPLVAGQEGISNVLPTLGQPSDFDYVIPLSNAFDLLGITPENSAEPYLVASQSPSLPLPNVKPFLKIGVLWSDRYREDNHVDTDIALREFEPLTNIPGIKVFIIQADVTSEEKEVVEKFGFSYAPRPPANAGEVKDLVSQLDLVIGCDGSPIHVAGAMGKPAWILQPEYGSWVWGRGEGKSKWYPSVEIFRKNNDDTDWSETMDRVYKKLKKFASSAMKI